MKLITISREYGAGGGEVARLLAKTLGWELLDRELLHRAAELEHVPDADLERWTSRPSAWEIVSACTLPTSSTGMAWPRRHSGQPPGRSRPRGPGHEQFVGREDVFHLRLVAPSRGGPTHG